MEHKMGCKKIGAKIYIVWILAAIFYVIPLLIDTADGALEIIWLLYLVPPVLLTIHHGYKGGISAAVIGFIIQMGMEFYEYIYEHQDYKPWNFVIVLAIALGMAVVTIGFSVLLKRLEKVSRQSEYLARHDMLTNLPNRRMFEEELIRLIYNANRHQKNFALVFLDLDRFKAINDTMGHETGDLILREVAQRLDSLLRPRGSIFRLGGDEFTILLTTETVQDAIDFVKSVLSKISQPIILRNQEFNVTASLGVAVYPEHGLDVSTLMRNADIAMYKAKEQGKNCYFLFSPELGEIISRKVNLERLLRDALERKEFVLYYQPQIDLKNGSIIGAEALVRWIHPEKGLIPPSEFIPLAEETGLIVPLGHWILRNAIQEAQKWHAMGYPLKIAVNVSAVQFQCQDCAERIVTILKEEKLKPHYLELEITESVALLNPAEILQKLEELRTIGVQIAIDDFGTGYSSFSYLKKYPVTTIKIDRSFVQDIAIETLDRTMLEAMLGMIRNLKFRTMAEGVETSEQLQMLQEFHCDLAQGYYFSRPVSAREFINLLGSHNEETLLDIKAI